MLNFLSLFKYFKRSYVELDIVDAFRYDFAVYNDNNHEPLAYQNKMPKLHARLQVVDILV